MSGTSRRHRSGGAVQWRQSTRAALIGTAALAGLIPSLAHAQAWTGNTDHDWFAATNWFAGTVPGAGSAVFIDEVTTSDPRITTAGALANSITIGSTPFISAMPHLSLMNGGTLTTNLASIGSGAGASGLVTVSDPGSAWTNVHDIIVGENGYGTLAIGAGGQVTNGNNVVLGLNAGAEGTVRIDDGRLTSSGALVVGNAGAGLMEASGGAIVVVGSIVVGQLAGGNGQLTLAGNGTTAVTGNLAVGASGSGTLDLRDGARQTATTVNLAQNAGSSGTIYIGARNNNPAHAAAAGSLDAPILSFGAGSGTIVFNHTDTNLAFAPAMSGYGFIEHVAGVTSFTDDSSAFTGTTALNGGTLRVNGNLGGAIIVGSGGTLGGSGTAGTVVVNGGGIVAPGNSIGTLNVTSAAFNAGSIYRVEVNAAGASDRINASGAITINGGTVEIVPYPDYAINTAYTILSAAGGISGNFDAISGLLPTLFLTPSLAYHANDVSFAIYQSSSFDSVAQTANQIAAARGADSLGLGSSVWNAIARLSDAPTARGAFDSLSGEAHASAQTVLIEDSRFVREAAVARTRAAFDAVASDSSGAAEQVLGSGVTLWAQGFGSWGSFGGDGNAAGVDRTIGGVLFGGDARLSANALVGVIGGYSASNFDIDARTSSGNAQSYHLGTYGGATWGAFGLRAGAAYTWNDVDTTRSAVFPGFADHLAASYGAETAQAFADAGWRIDVEQARFEPFANIAYVNLSTDRATESGGPAALTIASSDISTSFFTLGLRADTPIALAGPGTRLRGGLGWKHAFGDIVPASQMVFASGSDVFGVSGVPVAQDALVVDAGLDVLLAPATLFAISYGGQFGSGISDQDVKGSVRVEF